MGRAGATETPIAALLQELGKPWTLVRTVADRPGHDRRYAMSGGRLRALGFTPPVSFDEGIARTVAWYVENELWWRRDRSGEWHDYYARQYADRLAASASAD